MSSKQFICPNDHYSFFNNELNVNTEQLIANFKLTLGNRNRKDEEIKMKTLRCKTIERLKKNDQTLTFDDLIDLTNVKTIDEKIAFRKLKNRKTRKRLENVMKLAAHKYMNQTTNIRHLFDYDMTVVNHLQLLTISIDKASLFIENSILRDEKKYNEKLKKFKKKKQSFLQLVAQAEDQHKTITDKMNIEANNAKISGNELEESENIYEGAKNEVLRLLKETTVPEACYMILTWLSPSEWKREHNVQVLKFNFTKSYIDTMPVINDNYMNYAYQKPLAEFEEDLRSNFVFDMYWETSEQVNKKLARLEKKTRDKMTVMEKIREPLEILNHRQQYTYVNVHNENKNRLKENILLNKDHIGQIMYTYQPSLENILVENDTMLKIKSMTVDMYSKLKSCSYGKYIDVNKALKLLFDRLYEIRLESEKIPTNIWKLTKDILDKNNEDEIQRQLILNPKISIHKMKCNRPPTDVELKQPLHYKKVLAK